ncbi:laminin subunit alpha-3-like [Centropristis striata]|uniref:laminin subunit alpha-3-like n=1 Tax=Centropristis striata TaxID=184440 RepID=UPI0027E172A4|nr:laminin subunit alpha-3-like [Centropristis striata]
MQLGAGLLCAAWLFLLCFVCNSAEKLSKFRHDRLRSIHPNTHSTKRFCDPSFSNQTAGAVTQKCSSGFYRERVGPFRGQCVPCSCNGLSNECDEQTGNCVNCQSDSTGDRCERCRDGYYGNAADRTCRACPCPFTWNNFASACLDIGSGAVQCLCKRGYRGARCDRCSFRYFGNPAVPGGSCKPCNCKNGLNICDSLTGECITSGNSSSGDHCHDCDSCPVSLLGDLEKMDDVVARLKQQLQNVTNVTSRSRLNELQGNITETEHRSRYLEGKARVVGSVLRAWTPLKTLNVAFSRRKTNDGAKRFLHWPNGQETNGIVKTAGALACLVLAELVESGNILYN